MCEKKKIAKEENTKKRIGETNGTKINYKRITATTIIASSLKRKLHPYRKFRMKNTFCKWTSVDRNPNPKGSQTNIQKKS